MQKIKKNDEVIVLSGKSKGMRGRVMRVVSAGNKVLVEGVNLVKKHVRANPNANVTGGIVSREAPLYISKVAIYNPKTGKADRVSIKVSPEGKKIRCFSSNGEQIDV